MNKKITFDDLTRFKSVCNDKHVMFVIAQYKDNSIITLENDLNTNTVTQIKSPVLNSFFKMLQWIKGTENLLNHSVYVNTVNRQID